MSEPKSHPLRALKRKRPHVWRVINHFCFVTGRGREDQRLRFLQNIDFAIEHDAADAQEHADAQWIRDNTVNHDLEPPLAEIHADLYAAIRKDKP